MTDEVATIGVVDSILLPVSWTAIPILTAGLLVHLGAPVKMVKNIMWPIMGIGWFGMLLLLSVSHILGNLSLDPWDTIPAILIAGCLLRLAYLDYKR